MINEQALKDRLQTIAKEKEIPFNACWKQLAPRKISGSIITIISRQ